jgi:hypothetical protein
MISVVANQSSSDFSPIFFDLCVHVDQIAIDVGENGARRLQMEKDCRSSQKWLDVPVKALWKKTIVVCSEPTLSAGPLEKRQDSLICGAQHRDLSFDSALERNTKPASPPNQDGALLP